MKYTNGRLESSTKPATTVNYNDWLLKPASKPAYSFISALLTRSM